jgi:cation diffusion facilitator CzcD-associated flavoprotein CzcO
VSRHTQVAIIGGGFAGLGMACELKRSGNDDFVVFERADEVGGTWRDNTYPGCACDIRSDLYSFSFAPNPDWSSRYASQPEIQAYLRRTASKFRVEPHLRFRHEVKQAYWDGDRGVWQIYTSGGQYTADALVAGAGPLIMPKWPAIPGLDSFGGPLVHSARWDHDVDLAGKRVAVIGTGASAIQFVPQVQRTAAQVTVFQRTAPWVLPRGDRPTSSRRRELFRRHPPLQRAAREWEFRVNELRHLPLAHEWIGRLVEGVALSYLERRVRDPELCAKLTPHYRLGCKRILISDDYYRAVTKPNVEVVTEPITSISPRGVITAGGASRDVDVLIGATGFAATEPPVAQVIHGRDGRSLAEHWASHMEALHGTTVAGFPNFFMLVGPNTALGHNSIVYIIEAQIRYVLQALDFVTSRHVAIEPRVNAQRTYNERLQKTLEKSVWVRGGCTSFYLDASGRNSTLWPHRGARFRRTLRHFHPAHYEVVADRVADTRRPIRPGPHRRTPGRQR